MAEPLTPLTNAQEDARLLSFLTARLNQAEERLSMAMEAGEIGVWEWYLKPTPESGVLIWDNRMHKLFGTKPETWTGKYSGFAECLTPETLMITEAKIRAAIEHGIPYDYVFQLRLENGASWIHGKGKLYYGKRGEPERFVGVCLRTVFGNQVTHLLKQYEI